MGVVQQEPKPGGPGTSKRDGNWANRLGNPLMHDMHRSTRGCNPAREISFKTEASEEEKGMLADEERSRSTKVDRFNSQLHIVSSVDNDNNVSIGRTNWTLGTLEDDRNGASPLYARKDTTGTLDRSTDLEGFIVIVTQRLK